MKRIVWKYGLIGGAIVAVAMVAQMSMMDRIGFDRGMIVGYTTMVLAYLMVYFGIRAYRDQVLDGRISFGRAFKVGILITLITCTCYVATWEVLYHTVVPDFGEKWAAHELASARAAGATPAQIEAKAKEMADFQVIFRNPLYNVGMTFMEPLPVGIVITLVCAGVLSRARRSLSAGPSYEGAASRG